MKLDIQIEVRRGMVAIRPVDFQKCIRGRDRAKAKGK
jgi:hypothetical protein